MILRFLILLSLLFSITQFAQEPKSIHQIDYEKYGIKIKQKSFFDESGKDIIPLKIVNKGLNKVIFGYLPDWLYLTGRQYLNYNLLTHISTFDFVVNSSGNISFPSYWPWTDVINAAHEKGVKVIMTAVCFNSSDIQTILTNSTVKQNFFNNCKNIINQYKLDGVNVDFENVPTALRGDVINGFMSDLTNFIRSNLPGKEVSFAGPAVNWSGWNFLGLANSCDYIFIMGYDFYGNWSSTSGPSAPLIGGNYNITNTINVQYGAVVQSMPHKLILGVPYYGNRWTTQTLDPYSTVVSYIGSVAYKDAIVESNTYGLLWSANKTVWYRYVSSGSNYQVWFDNDSSLGLKYQLAQDKNLRGVGMWALGYDAGRNELWNELKKRFFVQGSVNLLAPNGGEVLAAGNTFQIRWNIQNSFRVKLEFSTNDGANWSIISQSYTSDSNKYDWLVPNIYSNKCRIKITDLNSDNVFDISDSAFTIIPNKPAVPNPLSPPNNAQFLNLGFTYMWTNSQGAQRFHLQVSKDTNFTNLFFNDSTITEAMKYVSGHTDGTIYYWRIAAENISGKSDFSNYFRLITKIIEPDSLRCSLIYGKYVKLDWINNSQTATRVIIQRKISGSNVYETIDTIPANIVTYLDTNVITGSSYYYRLQSINSVTYSAYSKEVLIVVSSMKENVQNLDEQFYIYNNSPNPFNAFTKLTYYVKTPLQLKIVLLNSLGQEVSLLKDDYFNPGYYELKLDMKDFSSGVYIVVFQTLINNETKIITRKINLLK